MRKKQIDPRQSGAEFRNVREAYFEILKDFCALIPLINDIELKQRPFNETKAMKAKLKEIRSDLQSFENEFSEVMAVELRK